MHKLLLAACVAANFATDGIAQIPATSIRIQQVTPVASGSYLGVWVWEIDKARTEQLKLPGLTGVEITRVRDDSPASRAGLRPGDVITKFNGQRIVNNDQFSKLVRETPVGQRATLEIYRGGTPQMVSATMGSAAGMAPVPPIVGLRPGTATPDMPRSMTTWRSPVLGVDAEALEGQLAGYFGVKQGVLVRNVVDGSAAQKAGLKAGDVILRVEGHEVATPADVSARLRAAAGNSATLVLMRDRHEITVTVMFDDERAHCCKRTQIEV